MANPVSLGTRVESEAGGAQSTVLTTSVAHLERQLLFVCVAAQAARTLGAMTDSVGNSYTVLAQASQASVKTAIYRSSGAIALGSGGTISLATSGIGGGEVLMSAFSLTPYKNATDASGTATGASGDPEVSITTVAAKTITIACAGQVYTGLDDTYTGDNDYTTMQGIGPQETTAIMLTCAYRVRTSAGADTMTFNWDTIDVAWAASILSMQLIEGGDTSLLLGV